MRYFLLVLALAAPVSLFAATWTPMGGGVPSGMIAFFYTGACPSGWIHANGTPDLRGEFVRGLDSGRGADVGRVIGTAQADELKSHTHTLPGSMQFYGWPSGSVVMTAISSTQSGAVGGGETRPRNVALLPCMKQ